ncbi:MAG: ribonuclease H-like domain-containing protein [Chitinophagaceae bacterium]|nr:ribonuclease H-like domain-containing protein [Chitinophagaceae bacterium]
MPDGILQIPPQQILFLDIETVPGFPSYEAMTGEWKNFWNQKAASLLRYHEGETEISLYPRAGIYAEFGKIICIGCGLLQNKENDFSLTLKCYAGDDEKSLLLSFTEMLNRWTGGDNKNKFLCAHNGKEFDFPYLCRRMLIQGIPVPDILNITGKKSWEVQHLDTMEMWKFGDYKNFTSLGLLSLALGIPTPKDDMDGSMVYKMYWEEKNLKRISTYCLKDVVALTQVFLRLTHRPLIKAENISIVENE